MTNNLIHKNFKLAGELHSSNDLIESLKDNTDYYNFLTSWFDENDFILVKTSGSTGTPKEIKLKKIDLISSSKLTADYFNLKPGDKVINCLPVEYIAGKMMLVRSLVLGLDLYLFPVNSSPIKQIQKNYDLIAFTPMQLENSILFIDRIKNVLVGGSAVNENLKQKILNINTNVYETYGMTETITHIAVRNLTKGENEFTTLPGIEIGKRDNCLFIKPNHLSIEMVQTNDIVQFTNKNKFLLIGRRDFIINSGGVKLNPETIEKKLAKYISADFVISSIDNSKFGEVVALVFKKNIPDNYSKAFTHLSKYEIPKEVLVIDNFPEINGKINRLKIRSIINNS
ncbi:MAG: O-succinylbenzoic acid--CoA ligase [Bacteroidetes bacterium]|nr:MAG: O-succinylbenzoic acid--CoA ligase [Bacteroidota bacterium]